MSADDPRDAWPMPAAGGELILVRHGQSTANAQGIGQGRQEWPLSPLGRRQAEATAARLAELGGIAAIYTSPLSRAADTAAAIGRALGLGPVAVPDLVEMDVGALAGKTWAELEASHPAEMAAYAQAEATRPHPRNRELIPGWEPIALVLARTWRAVADIAGRHPGARVVVVAHGGIFNGFLTHALTGDAHEVPWCHHLGNCAVTHLVIRPGGIEALQLRDTSHVKALCVT